MMDERRFLIKCDCDECNCESATPDGVCYECSRGLHRAEREYKASLETRKRIAKEEQELKDRED